MSYNTFTPQGASFPTFSHFKDLPTLENALPIWKNKIKNFSLFSLICLLPLILISSSPAFGNVGITKGTDPNFCSTYPSSYVSVGTFSIAETRINGSKGFTAGQSNVTLILDFGGTGAFEFNPGRGTVTETGTEVTINSFTITAASITVNLTTTASNIETNSIVFAGIQVKALAAGIGFIRRNRIGGGTFKIDNKPRKPSALTSWCDLTAGTPFAVTLNGTTATQTVTSSVFSGTTDNQIIGIQVTIAGTCSSLAATAFNFNTTGSTNAATDIASAKLYFTNTANAFSTADLIGSISFPVGAFQITTNQPLTAGAGTYYFWLVYDIRTTATNGNVVDAQLVSSVISGTTFSPATGNPGGTRTISNNVFYSIAPGTWNNTAIWSKTPGGPTCTCAPVGGNGFVYVNHAVSLDASRSVNFVTVQANGILTNTAGSILTVSDNLSTTGNGVFTASTSWVLNNVITAGTGLSSSSAALTVKGSLNVGSGTALTGGAGLTINGNIIVDGTLALGTSNATSSTAAGTTVQGTGSITGSGMLTFGVNKSIAPGSNLTIFPSLSIPTNIEVKNNGTVIMQNNIIGGNGNSTWTNAANSVLNMGGTTSALLTIGTLNASAVPNTVNYNGSGSQTIKTPSTATYYNLRASTSGTKSLSADIVVTNVLQISGTAQLSAGANDIDFNGDWINNSSTADAFISNGTVNFVNVANISGTGVNSFNNISIGVNGLLTSNSNTGKVKVTGNWVNVGDFEANNSDIIFDGTSTISGGSGDFVTEFNTVIVNASKTLTLDNTETDIDGDLTANGTVIPNGGLLAFLGSGNTQNINGAATNLGLSQVEVDNSGGNVLLSRPVTINNALTLTHGNLNISSNNLTLVSTVGAIGGGPFSATTMIVTSGSGAVLKNGTSTTTASYTFPVGDNTGIAEYSPITLTFTAGTFSNGFASVRVVNAKHPNSASVTDFLNRYWTVATSGYTVTGATVAATYTDADIAGTEANILMGRYGGSLPWTRFSSSINTGTNTLTTPSINSFGDFSGQGCTVGLSIEVSILGNVSSCGTDNGFFTIRVFPRIGTTATAFKPYSWTLTPPVAGSFTPEPSAPFKFSKLPQNAYSVSMTDGSGCASNTLTGIVIGKDEPVVVRVGSYQKPSCNGSDGQMVVFADQGSHSTYRYSYSTDGGTTYSTPQSGHRFVGLAAGPYIIKATDSRGCEGTLGFTLPAPANCPAIAASTDNFNAVAKNVLKLQVLPNPTKTSFTLNLQSSSRENVQITVTDMLGKKVYQTSGSSSQRYTFGHEFNSGMYIVQVIQGKQIQTLKLVKGN